ncbi:MAG: PhoU domain-containing protein [Alphaproteobacteria bacterium]|nr:PhoU domain-containing protein [Alphaproteobacteria bacterium]
MIRPQSGIPALGRLVQELLKEILDAMADNDPAKCLDVRARDEHVDELYNSVFRELLTYMMEDPRNITATTHILFIAKNLERIGDHATNIAETLHYAITGVPLREARPKSDVTSLTLVDPGTGDTIVAGRADGDKP